MSPPVSPAVLRAAAERLRERAKGATPGPWVIGGEHGLSSGHVWTERSGYQASVGFSVGEGEEADLDAAYIATVHPGVALALADWLEREAELKIEFDEVLLSYKKAGFGVTEKRSSFDEAIAVAEAVLS